MRARQPDRSGHVERDGVRVAWQVYGEQRRPEDPAVLLLPTWCLLPAEVWKLQVPFLARRTRVITYDPRGNGASDRPEDASAYARAQLTRDALDVLDATGTERAVVVGLSRGNLQALDLAADHRDRVAAWVAIAPAIPGLAPFPPERLESFDLWDEDTGDDDGWGRYNRYSWLRDYPGLRRLLLRPAGAGGPLHQADRGPGRLERRHRRRHPGPRRGRTPTRAEVGVASSARPCAARSSSCTAATTGSSPTRTERDWRS